MSAMVCVARFDTREEAEIARGALAAAGLEATVSADDVGGAIHLTNGVEVLVLEEHAAAASEIIRPEDRPSATLADSQE